MTARNAEIASNQLLMLLESDIASDEERAAQSERAFVALVKAALPVQFDEARILVSDLDQLRLPKD